jgi:hypothetical protein
MPDYSLAWNRKRLDWYRRSENAPWQLRDERAAWRDAARLAADNGEEG